MVFSCGRFRRGRHRPREQVGHKKDISDTVKNKVTSAKYAKRTTLSR